jgi:type I restriction enzyme R subunit
VLDFANEAEAIRLAFQPYYDRTLLSEGMDPNLLYDLERRLAEFYFYNPDEADRFAAIYLGQLGPNVALPQLHAMLDPVVERYREATADEQADFRKILTDYVRLYAFLAQVAPFSDAHLEKLYLFGRLLRRKLPGSPDTLPLEVQQQIELESLRIAKTSSGDIGLERGQTQLTPMRPKAGQTQIAAHVDALSAIIQDLNERYGFTDFSDEEVFTVQRIETKADISTALKASAQVNTPDNFRLSFDNFIKERFQELLEDNFKLYKKITDDPDFAKSLLDALFERYLKRLGSNGEALAGAKNS